MTFRGRHSSIASGPPAIFLTCCGRPRPGSQEALDTLGEYMVHQGTLCEATAYLTGFLARIAASGVASVQILDLLGVTASCDGDGQDPDVRGKTRAALAAATGVLAPLLADPAGQVRDAAAWALPQSLAAGRLIPLLRQRWDQETSPAIAASVLRGLSFLDAEGTAALAAGALDSRDSTIRLIAALACAEAGMPWSAGLAGAALAWTGDGALMKGFRWSSWSGHPFSDRRPAPRRDRPAPAAAPVVTRLRELAGQDRRIRGAGVVQYRIRDDDQLRAAIRDLLDGTGQPAPPLAPRPGTPGPAASR